MIPSELRAKTLARQARADRKKRVARAAVLAPLVALKAEYGITLAEIAAEATHLRRQSDKRTARRHRGIVLTNTVHQVLAGRSVSENIVQALRRLIDEHRQAAPARSA